MQAIIHDRIWDSILNGELKPGSKVPELQIGAAFNVSRTIVRNVLIVMEQEGVITLPPNRGAYIAIHGADTVSQTFESIRVAACHIVRALSEKNGAISAQDRARLMRHVKFKIPDLAARNPRSHMRFGMEFLLLIGAVYGNPILLRLLERTTSIIVIALPQFQFKPVFWPLAEAKLDIIDAILAGNADQAERALVDFLAPLELAFNDRPKDEGRDVSSIISSLSQGLALPSPARQRNAQHRKPRNKLQIP